MKPNGEVKIQHSYTTLKEKFSQGEEANFSRARALAKLKRREEDCKEISEVLLGGRVQGIERSSR